MVSCPQCENSRNFLPFGFYVKSFCAICAILMLGYFIPMKLKKLPKVISRKIWMVEKFSIFHTVSLQTYFFQKHNLPLFHLNFFIFKESSFILYLNQFPTKDLFLDQTLSANFSLAFTLKIHCYLQNWMCTQFQL